MEVDAKIEDKPEGKVSSLCNGNGHDEEIMDTDDVEQTTEKIVSNKDKKKPNENGFSSSKQKDNTEEQDHKTSENKENEESDKPTSKKSSEESEHIEDTETKKNEDNTENTENADDEPSAKNDKPEIRPNKDQCEKDVGNKSTANSTDVSSSNSSPNDKSVKSASEDSKQKDTTNTPLVKEKSRSGTPTPTKDKNVTAEDKTVSPNDKKKDRKVSKVTQVLKDASSEITNLRPIAQMLFDIGMDTTRQFVYRDLIKIQKKKESMDKLDEKEKEQLDKLQDAYDDLISKNQTFINESLTCLHCSFKTDTQNVLELHKEYAHNQDYNMFTCSICNESTKVASQYLYHMEAVHNRKGRIFMKHSFFICPFCPYESNNRGPFQKHIDKCTRHFREKHNLIPLAPDCDIPLKAPAKPIIPEKKIPTVAASVLAAQQRAKAVAAAQQVAQQAAQQQIAQAKAAMLRMQAVQAAARSPAPYPVRPPVMASPITPRQQMINTRPTPPPPAPKSIVRPQPSTSSTSPGSNSKDGAGTLVQMNGQWYRLAMIGSQQFLMPVPPPNVNQIPQNKPIVVQAENTPQNMVSPTSVQLQKDSNFEVCEICGGFVKDRDSLRIHFFWAHKVDIHKDIFKNPHPPLSCAMCAKAKKTLKFWTYQGLSRHRNLEHKIVEKENDKSTEGALQKGIPRKCVVCSHTYPRTITVKQYWQHMEMHGITKVKLFLLKKCLICGLACPDSKMLEKHLLGVHSILFHNISLQDSQNIANQKTPKSKAFDCDVCEMSFKTEEIYTEHCKNSHLKCSRCRMTLINRAALLQHLQVKHGNDKDQCILCPEKIKFGRPMVRHIKSDHLKACSVVLMRLPEEQVAPYLKDMDKSPTSGKLRKSIGQTPVKLGKRRTSANEVIVIDFDSPQKARPSKRPAPAAAETDSSPINEPASKKQILEVDGEEIVVEIQQADDSDHDDDDAVDISGENDEPIPIDDESTDAVKESENQKVSDDEEGEDEDEEEVVDLVDDDDDDDDDDDVEDVEDDDDENSKDSLPEKKSNSSDIQQIEIHSDDSDEDLDELDDEDLDEIDDMDDDDDSNSKATTSEKDVVDISDKLTDESSNMSSIKDREDAVKEDSIVQLDSDKEDEDDLEEDDEKEKKDEKEEEDEKEDEDEKELKDEKEKKDEKEDEDEKVEKDGEDEKDEKEEEDGKQEEDEKEKGSKHGESITGFDSEDDEEVPDQIKGDEVSECTEEKDGADLAEKPTDNNEEVMEVDD